MKSIFSLLILLCAYTASGQPPKHVQLDSIRNLLQQRVDKGEAASVAVAVAQNGRILWKEAFGWADRENRVRATAKTVYPLASLSKSMTATAVWLLAEQGKIRLDAPVNRYLTSVPLTYYQGHPDSLKIRHLLNMAGGIPHQLRYHYDAGGRPLPSVKDQIRQFGFVAYPPGRQHIYSNFSYAVADQLIADASGMSYSEYLQNQLFKPLKMTQSSTERPLSFAKGYFADGTPVAANRFLPRGGAGLYASLDDVLAFGLMHLNRNETGLLRASTLARMHSESEPVNPYYANGWGRLPMNDGRVMLLANGAIAGAATTLILLPGENIAIACLTNSTLGNDFTDGIGFSIAFALVSGLQQSFEKLIGEVGPLFTDRPFASTPDWLGQWAGQMKSGTQTIPVRITFGPDNSVHVVVGQQREIVAAPAVWERTLLKIRCPATLPVSGLPDGPHEAELELVREGNRLFGCIRAISTGPRPGFSLPYPIELRKP